MLQQVKTILENRKGLSEIVGYVLLITFAVIMGVIVYNWMSSYILTEKTECPEDVSLVVKSYTCSEGRLDIEFQNKGLFNISAFKIRGSAEPNKERATISFPRIGSTDYRVFQQPLSPNGESQTKTINYGKPLAFVEITPYIFEKGKSYICTNAMIKQELKNCILINPCEGQSDGTPCGTNGGVCDAEKCINPVIWLKFNDDDFIDSSGNNNNGVDPIGGVYFVSDYYSEKVQTVANFTGTGYVRVNNADTLNFGTDGDFTVMFWANISSSDIDKFVLDKGYMTPGTIRYGVYANSFYISDGVATYYGNPGEWRDGTWHHLAFSVDRSVDEIKSYLDGNLLGTIDFPSGIDVSSTNDLYIGAQSPPPQESFLEGRIDDVRIYPKVLNAAEINVIKNGEA